MHRPPAEIAEALNVRMIQELETEHYFTFAFADVDVNSGYVQMVQAGHPHPVIFNPATGVKFVGEGGLPIGLLPDAQYESFEFDLVPGDRLLLYSDGLTECQNPSDDLLDEDGLTDVLTRQIGNSGPKFMRELMGELTAFAQGRPFADDLSAILFEYKNRTDQPILN